MSLDVGNRIPEFTLPTDGGGTISSADLRGRTAVIYFYPKDDTPGCTKEAQAFRVARAFGVWVEKSMYGKKYMGLDRSTFLVDRDGVIRQAWRKVKVPGHAEEVLELARSL